MNDQKRLPEVTGLVPLTGNEPHVLRGKDLSDPQMTKSPANRKAAPIRRIVMTELDALNPA